MTSRAAGIWACESQGIPIEELGRNGLKEKEGKEIREPLLTCDILPFLSKKLFRRYWGLSAKGPAFTSYYPILLLLLLFNF